MEYKLTINQKIDIIGDNNLVNANQFIVKENPNDSYIKKNVVVLPILKADPAFLKSTRTNIINSKR